MNIIHHKKLLWRGQTHLYQSYNTYSIITIFKVLTLIFPVVVDVPP